MAEKMRFTAVFAAVLGFALSAAEAGVVYPDEASKPWFTAGVTNMSNAGGAAVAIVGGQRWTAPTYGDAFATNQLIQFDTEVADPLVYTANGSSDVIALVEVKLFVDPNAVAPTTDGLVNAQAAISVVTNSTDGVLNWIGLVGNGVSREWVTLTGDYPVKGGEYDVQIAIDNRAGHKKVRYAVKAVGATPYVVLKYGGEEWLANPKGEAETSVSAVAFAGAGTIGEFSGVALKDDGATIASTENLNTGYDFTNGTITAVVTIPSDNASAATRTATLRLVPFSGGAATTVERTVTSGDTISWDLPNLTAGGTYSYTITVKSGNTEREVKSGTFTAGTWHADGSWFKLAVVDNQAVTNNGTFAGAEFNSTRWDVASDAAFTVADSSEGRDSVARVDTSYAFSSFTDTESLEALDGDALGGIVAVSDGGGRWCAYTATGETGWVLLSGGVVPETNVEYVVRAEFDFRSSTRRVRYMVSGDGGLTFAPLALANGSEWINLAVNRDSLASVGVSGTGYVKSIFANVSDAAVAVANGVRYASLWDALASGHPVTLLTNATLAPSGVSGKQGPFTITKGAFDFIFDKSGLSGKWRFEKAGDVWYLSKPGATYIFF